MIIKKIKLGPFGGISDREIVLEEGLNVIVGPNEAGKSTIYNGIQKALFTPSKLDKRSFEKEMRNHIPIGGGDTAKIELHLLKDDKLHQLKKSWGGSKTSELILPDGTVISNEANVSEKLGNLMVAGPGTYKSVLMAYQSGLAKTLEDLKNESQTLHSFGDIIRKALFETEGISVERFNQEIEKLYMEYFDHWDRSQEYPENNRGIENPYQRGVGTVLKAFYTKEEIRSKLQNAVGYEEAIANINRELEICQLESAEKENYLKQNTKAVEDARKRYHKSLELERSKTNAEIFLTASRDWLLSESKERELNALIPADEAKLKRLKSERSKAEVKAANEKLIETFNRVKRVKADLEGFELALKEAQKLDDSELQTIREAFREERLKASVEACELRACFEARTNHTLKIKQDFNSEYIKDINSGEVITLEAGGKLRLEHPEWKLEITNGKSDIEKISQEYDVAKSRKEELQSLYTISSLKEAEEINENYKRAVSEVTNATKNLNKELGETSYEELVRSIEQIGADFNSDDSGKSLIQIVEEETKLDGNVKAARKELATHVAKISELSSKYGSMQCLLSKLAESNTLKDNLEVEIKTFALLPDGEDNDEKFIKKYESVSEELKECTQKRYDILKKRLDFEKDAPEESAEELAEQAKKADADFRNILRNAEAVARIREVSCELLSNMDSGTYGGLKKDLEEYISFMTNGRHSSVKMADSQNIPSGFVRDDGAVLDYEMLSAGTKDVLSLALRMSMANYFLKEEKGFLIMDDPFVDMDPERQQRTGELIRKFAEDKQVIIFTCHPSHAAFLGGKQIAL